MSLVNVTNLGFGGSGIPDAMPKAIAELQGLSLAVVAGAAAGTVMPVTGMDPEDTIAAAVDLTGDLSIDVTTLSVPERNAKATATCLTTAVDGDTIVVNGKTYTFRNVVQSTSYNAPPNVIPITVGPSGVVAADVAKVLAQVIMSGDSTLTATVAGAIVTMKVRTPGTAGNSYTLVETGNAVTISGANFTGGVAAASQGFVSSASLAGKKVMVLWFDKRPGVATQPLLMRRGEEEEDEDVLSAKGKLVFKSGKKDDDKLGDTLGGDKPGDAADGRGDDEGRGDDDKKNHGKRGR